MKRQHTYLITSILLMGLILSLSACGGDSGGGGADGNQSVLTAVRNTAPADVCPDGGISVDAGFDSNKNGHLDDNEIIKTQYVCHGKKGSDGLTSLVSVTGEPAGLNCTTGGKKVSAGLDINKNNVLDPSEITSTSYVCNGLNGTNGLTSLVTSTYEPSGGNCAYGGLKIISGLDTNKNGVLDSAEINSTGYSCNGASGMNGNDGFNALVAMVTEPSGSHCPSGGKKINVGLDTDRNGSLDSSEITSWDYVCNGIDGTNGINGFNSLMTIASEAPGVNCQQGGTKIQSGLDANSNGVLDLIEVTATSYICGDEQAPTTPLLTATAVSSSQINLSWTVSWDNIAVVAYDIWRGYERIATVYNNSYSDTGLMSATTYSYMVDAYDRAGNISVWSAPASAMTFDITPPSAPTSLLATALSATQIILSWTAAADNVGVSGYHVYREGSQIATTATTSYLDSGLMSGTTYTYIVSAYDAAGNISTQSNVATVTTMNTLPLGLVAYYPFNGNANDASGNGFNGTVYGASLTSDRHGRANHAYSFNGTSDYIGLANTGTLNFETGGFTLAAWARFTADNIDEAIIGKHVCGVPAGYFLGVGSFGGAEKNSIEFFVSSDARIYTTEKYNDGNWHFVVGTYDDTNQYLYVDGILKVYQAKAYDSFSSIDISIGRAGTNCIYTTDAYFEGHIDDVRIYNRALSDTEVLGLYNLERLSSPLPDTGQIISYTTTNGEDSDYTGYLPSYVDNNDGTVKDRITGLLWQKQDDGVKRSWADSVAYCHNLSIGDSVNWRLPSRIELISIVDFGRTTLATNTVYFPTHDNADYWTSAVNAANSAMSWEVYFSSGYSFSSTDDGTINPSYVRCVQGQQIAVQNLTDNGDGTVTDRATHLMWQQVEGSAKMWEDALIYCENLSLGIYADWRLPNIKELSALVDDTKYSPAINIGLFPSTQSSSYWSSTTTACCPNGAWSINFDDGHSYSAGKTGTSYVRCVRGGE